MSNSNFNWPKFGEGYKQVYEPKRTHNLDSVIKAYVRSISKLENWIWAKIAKIIIWFVCILKISAIVVLLMGINTWVVALSFVYIIVALIHIYITGYFMAGFNFNIKAKKERQQYLNDIKEKKGTPGAIIQNSVQQEDRTLCEIQISKSNEIITDILKSQPHVFLNSFNQNGTPKEHRVTYDNSTHKLMLRTWGVIDDNTLYFLSNGGNSNIPISENLTKSFIAYLGLRNQLEQNL